MRSKTKDLERLERELEGSAYQALLRKLQRKHLFLRSFRSWADVVTFMRNGNSNDPRKDEVLRPIFKAHTEDEDPRWRAVLLVIFWPGLESIHFQKRNWDVDPDERWQNVTWTFLRVICRVNVNRRPDRLVQKVFNDTVHHLHDEYQRTWNRTNGELMKESEEIEVLAGAVEGIDFDGIELRQAHEKEVARLRAHLDAGRITEADFLLLVGTRLYGQSISEYARDAGLKTEAAKKRRQRAEAAIRSHEKEMP